MDEGQTLAFEALSRGRLIFPFQEEIESLRSVRGDNTAAEVERLSRLEQGRSKIEAKDKLFNEAMRGGDLVSAERFAKEAVRIAEDLA